jgi:hypothetical protein
MMQMTKDAKRVQDVINSCATEEHFASAKNMIDAWEGRHVPEMGLRDKRWSDFIELSKALSLRLKHRKQIILGRDAA